MLADVDGTLVTQEKVLTDRALEAVQLLRNAGILFAITSGFYTPTPENRALDFRVLQQDA